jgi:hypothetical protein
MVIISKYLPLRFLKKQHLPSFSRKMPQHPNIDSHIRNGDPFIQGLRLVEEVIAENAGGGVVWA